MTPDLYSTEQEETFTCMASTARRGAASLRPVKRQLKEREKGRSVLMIGYNPKRRGMKGAKEKNRVVVRSAAK